GGEIVERADLPLEQARRGRIDAAGRDRRGVDGEDARHDAGDDQRLRAPAGGPDHLEPPRHRMSFTWIHSTASCDSSFPSCSVFRPTPSAQMPHHPARGKPIANSPRSFALIDIVENALCGYLICPSAASVRASRSGGWFMYSTSSSACGTGSPSESTMPRKMPPVQFA